MALLVSYALVIELLHGKGRTLLAAAAVVFAFPRPGLLIGSGLAAAIAIDGQFAFVQSTMLAFVLLYVIMAGVWFIRTREKRSAERAIRRRDDLIKRYARAREDMLAMVCEDLAAECGLTKREAEMLNLFARGRDAAYAETALFLSRNTVKSYSKTLYAKLGVHSRQDLRHGGGSLPQA